MLDLKGKYTDCKIFADTVEECVVQQVYDIINSKAFDGQKVVCMPDVHCGKSGPCGLVATIGDYVCPDHIGIDIGCSVSMLILDKKLPSDKYAEFEHRIKKNLPMGKTINEKVTYDEKAFRKYLASSFARYKQMWSEMLNDLPDVVTEKWISEQLKRIGMNEAVFYKSIPSVGGGNHFVEYDENEDFGAVTVHFGSRNFGVKVCNYWMNKTKDALSKDEIHDLSNEFKASYGKVIDAKKFKKDLIAYLETKKTNFILGYLRGDRLKGYMCDMAFAQAYAAWNHHVAHDVIKGILLKYGIKVDREITSVHNYIDLEDRCLRKSAIRAHEGEEILIPFNMRDGIAICIGKGNTEWLNSCSHGSGRLMSRSKAKEVISLDAFTKTMEGIYSTTVNSSTIDEAPMAYKDTEEIMNLIKDTCEIKTVLKPKINIKAAVAEEE